MIYGAERNNKRKVNEKIPNKFTAREKPQTFVTCLCDIEVHGANEYEALEEVVQMIEKEYNLLEKVTITIKETITTTSFGCGVNYERKNAK